MQKRKRIFDQDQSPIRQVQKYCATSLQFDEESKTHYINLIEDKKQLLQTQEVIFTPEQINKFKEYSLTKLNGTAMIVQKNVKAIKIQQPDKAKFEQMAREFEKRINSINKTCKNELIKLDNEIENKMTEDEMIKLLQQHQQQVNTACVTKLTHDGFMEMCQSEISTYSNELNKQLLIHQQQLQPQPTSDLQALNSLLDSTNGGYEEIMCNLVDLDKQMAQFQKQLEMNV